MAAQIAALSARIAAAIIAITSPFVWVCTSVAERIIAFTLFVEDQRRAGQQAARAQPPEGHSCIESLWSRRRTVIGRTSTGCDDVRRLRSWDRASPGMKISQTPRRVRQRPVVPHSEQ